MSMPDEKHRLAFLDLEGLFGYVTVNGQPAEVYGAQQEGRKAVGYVEAKQGQTFEVAYYDGRLTAEVADPHVVRLYIDGTPVNSVVVKADHARFALSENAAPRTSSFAGAEQSPSTLLPFLFLHLQTTDSDERACTDEAVVKGMGSVQLRYHRIKNVRQTETFFVAGNLQQQIHEKSKKATLSHQAGLAAPILAPKLDRFLYDYVDSDSHPLSCLEFRYRSRTLLQLDGLIPDSPAASPAVSASPSPQPARPSPSPVLPVAGPSRRRASSSHPSGPPDSTTDHRALDLDDDALAAEIESLKRQERLAQLEREQRRRGQAGSSGSQSSQKKVKAEPLEPLEPKERMSKKVKLEEVDKVEKAKEESRKKGKQPEVLDLCGSD